MQIATPAKTDRVDNCVEREDVKTIHRMVLIALAPSFYAFALGSKGPLSTLWIVPTLHSYSSASSAIVLP